MSIVQIYFLNLYRKINLPYNLYWQAYHLSEWTHRVHSPKLNLNIMLAEKRLYLLHRQL